MKTYQGKQTVDPGVYFDAHRLRFRTVEHRDALPGPTYAVFRRVPEAALLIAGPLLGLAFVIFLPLIGIVAAVWALGAGGRDLLRRGRRSSTPLRRGKGPEGPLKRGHERRVA